MSTETAFGARLRALRAEKGFTQEQLAAASGLGRVALAKMESGLRGRDPAWSTVQRLADALGTTTDAFRDQAPPEDENPVEAVKEATKANEEVSKPKKWTREPVGVLESQNAINCLCRIPDDDPHLEIGLKTVATWIRRNLPRKNTNGKAQAD